MQAARLKQRHENESNVRRKNTVPNKKLEGFATQTKLFKRKEKCGFEIWKNLLLPNNYHLFFIVITVCVHE